MECPTAWTSQRSAAADLTAFNIDIGRRSGSGSAATEDGSTVFVMTGLQVVLGDPPVILDGAIGVLDAEAGLLLDEFDLSAFGVGQIYSGAAVVGQKLYVLGNLKVAVVDVDSREVLALVDQIRQLGRGGVAWGRAAVSPLRDRVYTVYGASVEVLAIDTTTDALVGSTFVGVENTGIGVSPDGERIYVSDRVDGELTIVSATDFTILDLKSFTTETGFVSFTTAVAVALPLLSVHRSN